MGFFKLYKPRKYDYRYIYYDSKKEAQKDREKRLAEEGENGAEFRSTIKRGTFRAEAAKNKSSRSREIGKSNIRLVLIIFFLLLLAYYLLK
ncbi:MAG: hypothetical protein PHS59_01090 [Paludibacter sp.]|nr:hypothetical protein [Paludibacter sp.]